MPVPTEFEIRCAREAIGETPWPDLFAAKFVNPPGPVFEDLGRDCKRCHKSIPLEGDRCPHCRANQLTYGTV